MCFACITKFSNEWCPRKKNKNHFFDILINIILISVLLLLISSNILRPKLLKQSLYRITIVDIPPYFLIYADIIISMVRMISHIVSDLDISTASYCSTSRTEMYSKYTNVYFMCCFYKGSSLNFTSNINRIWTNQWLLFPLKSSQQL